MKKKTKREFFVRWFNFHAYHCCRLVQGFISERMTARSSVNLVWSKLVAWCFSFYFLQKTWLSGLSFYWAQIKGGSVIFFVSRGISNFPVYNGGFRTPRDGAVVLGKLYKPDVLGLELLIHTLGAIRLENFSLNSSRCSCGKFLIKSMCNSGISQDFLDTKCQ